MANQKHLHVLEQGVDAWNTWRLEHPDIKPDLRHIFIGSPPRYPNEPDLGIIYIKDSFPAIIDHPTVVSSCRACLRRINFSKTDLRDSDLTNIDLSGADLSGALLTNSSLNIACLHKANLSEAELLETDLYRSDCTEAIFTKAILVKTKLQRANCSRAILEEADLENADLRETNFSNANLESAKLGGAVILQTNFDHAIMRKIELTGMALQGTIFFDSSLTNADLSEADLTNADFKQVNMQNVNLYNAIMAWTAFGSLDLSTVKGLETIIHRGPSIIGIDTILRSKANIPKIFLQGIGASDTFIDYVDSLTRQPIEYHSCFISYSSKDKDFVDLLLASLQQNGIRCWFAPKDLKIGDEIRMGIDESILIYDKLLVVLSEHSVNSAWVEDEVEAALEKERLARERGEKQTVLFPIQIDDAVKGVTIGWPAKIRRTKNIGDFRNWDKSYVDYMKAFEKLMCALKADT